MGNIWVFLLQTLSVSLVAAVLLLTKRVFEDTLSPRWQYGIWSLLALRILLPVGVKRSVILPLPLWIESLKSWVEGMLSSNYSQVYEGLSMNHVLPQIRQLPVSVTDGLFVVYGLVVAVTLLWYGFGYLRLRLLLRKGKPVHDKLAVQIRKVAGRYGLAECRAVTLHGLSSAFVCGVFHPVMAVPAEGELDDKVILHELLHLTYGDGLQSIGWCVLRALHWCNPFLQYVFYRIHCDMESLCDQRVLERLEGEERRQYGAILLNMANETYASMPGTTSISNGGKNISRRIAAIVRFKKYPRGMALVSICILIVLASPLLMGADYAYGNELYEPGPRWNLPQSMAMTRLNRCTTMAGALDTYAKGLILENGIYIASASSLSKQQELAAQMEKASREEGWAVYHLEAGQEFDHIDRDGGYSIWNMEKQADGSYSALLAFPIKYFDGTASETEYWELSKRSQSPMNVTLVVPVTVRYEDAWVVEESGERICTDQYYHNCDDGELYPDANGSPIPFLRTLQGGGRTGSVRIDQRVLYRVENPRYLSGFGVSSEGFDLTPQVDGVFDEITIWSLIQYVHDREKVPQGPMETVQCYQYVEMEDGSWHKEMEMFNRNLLSNPWEGRLLTSDWTEIRDWDGDFFELPKRARFVMEWDGQPADDILMEVVPDGRY